MRRAEAVLASVLALVLVSFAVRGEEYGRVFSKADDAPGKIALTFDDGPHPRLTEEILDVLSEYGVKATFFVVGENAEKYPLIVEREVREGHEIGNHTFSHRNVKTGSSGKIKKEITATEDAVFEAIEYRPRLFRPPEGKLGATAKRIAAELGYTVVLWSVDTEDWRHRSAGEIEKAALSAGDGDVILCHDFISGGSNTAEALRRFIPKMLAEGYVFVTVSELIGE
ncbi:MAG: polysaccharide deacetylase family protein [Clostridia bacterium]|nr:polysaccharide deacetylase family protein [Clostridia bacterium]